MALLDKLMAKGVKVYESTPLWVAGATIIAKLPVGNDVVVMDGKFGPQIAIEEDGKRAYIQLKTGVATDKKEYKVVEFSASRDWEEYNIVAGQTKLFAV